MLQLVLSVLQPLLGAEVSNDSELVAQLNKYAQAATVSKDFKTVTEMRDELVESGFELANLKLDAEKQGYVIGFDIKKDRFVLLKGGKAADGYTVDNPLNVFAFVKTEAEAALYGSTVNKFSLYLQKEFTATGGALAVTTGVDVGENNTITSITYDRHDATDDQEVVIRTNGGTLTVDAANDTVSHYGDVSVLNIEAVATSSYHEYGIVANAQIKKGRIVIERSEASIDNLLLIAKTDKSGFENIVVETKSNAELPVFDRTDVNISENGTLVLNVVTPTSDEYIYLTKAGVIEQIVVTNEEMNVSGLESNVASKSEKTQEVASQIANIGTKNEEGNYVDSNGNEIALESLTSENIVIEEKKADDVAITLGTTKFAGGAGTEKSPYLIATLGHWNNIAIDSENEKEFADKGLYYSVVSDLVFDADFKYIDSFSGTIDFKNHTINCNNDIAGVFIKYAGENTLIKNLNIQNTCSDFSIVYSNLNDITFENVKMYGAHTVSGNNSGMFVMLVGYQSNQNEETCVTLKNCDIYSSITGVGDNFVGGFLGTFNYLRDNQIVKLIMKDCTNYGTIIGENVAMVVSNPSSCSKNFVSSWDVAPTVKMYFKNVRNEGLLYGNSYSGIVMSKAGMSGYFEHVEAGKTRGTIEFYSDENFENLITENDERVKLNEDITPSVLDIKNDRNGLNISGPFSKVVVDSNKVIDFSNMKSNKAAKYVISFGWNGVHGALNGGAYSYNIEIPSNQIDTAIIYAYEWVNMDTLGDSKAVIATDLPVSDMDYFGTILKIDSQNRYVFNVPNSCIRTQPTIRVYAFDSNDNVINVGTEDGTVVLEENLPTHNLDLVWRSAMPLPATNVQIGTKWDNFYFGADGFSCSTNEITYYAKRQYTLKISETYNDIDFKIRIIFFNSETGLITEILGEDASSYNGGKTLKAGDTWTFAPTLSTSDRFYVTGYCGNPGTHNGDKAAHANCVSKFQSNITIISENISTN